jgi:hypothetical protein
MLTIKYILTGGEEASSEFKSVEEFTMLQMREVPTLQDHLKVISADVDGKELDFKGNIGELFNYLELGKL